MGLPAEEVGRGDGGGESGLEKTGLGGGEGRGLWVEGRGDGGEVWGEVVGERDVAEVCFGEVGLEGGYEAWVEGERVVGKGA